MEFGAGVPPHASAEVIVVDGEAAVSVWLLVAGRVAAAASVIRP
jgi:hypothetical protein